MQTTNQPIVLRLAIQKSGRLFESSVQLLRRCGIDLQNGTGKLKAAASNFPIEVYFLRDDDIPGYVADGVADLGIAGENVIYESGAAVEVVEKLGFGRCRLSIALPRDAGYSSPADLQGRRIATSYPRLLGDFLRQNGVQASIHPISGSVEIAPGIGLADAVCDLVSSGSTLFTNGLCEVTTILHSEAVLISRPELDADRLALLDKLLLRIRAVNAARRHKYILLNAPNDRIEDIAAILPGMKSPTVLPLATPGWSSLHSVVEEDRFWEIIEDLKALGAQGILVAPIEKMIV
ncbi:MAG: ATP phosphoribosyltransferase [Saprospirales bacterium]|nr:ATP phosphoribosyltransferase [Saprospirales bacterium]